ncbi:hypothetical protein HX127_08825 [Acinetobacter sp. 256-1]|uniref:hypothetical protein n=1 Tax=Acinetobacter sp. 256-1 TaxID=2746721 RepID=UPI0025783802|nr:hypothetical protein [Acinetobacter sp. 256-1]MDM1757671.1 hypothetical protein [Acinetobacter sp. 256-1]
MKKILISFLLIFSTTLNHAEKWTNGFSHGSEEYNLKNKANQTITYSCNEAMSENTENGFWLKNENEIINGEDGLAVMTDSLYFTPFPKETQSVDGSLQGLLFTAQLATAKTIDVFMQVKQSSWVKIASFKSDQEASFKKCPSVYIKNIM